MIYYNQDKGKEQKKERGKNNDEHERILGQ